MSNEVIVQEQTKELTWNKSQIDLIKRTVAKGATDDEFNMYMYMAKTYQLDPIMREIWFIKYDAKSTPIIMTSRDGYLAIANRNEHFQGMLSDVVHENDEFEKLPDGLVKHKYGCKDRGEIIGAYAMGFRNDRKYPVYVFAHLSEYYKAGKVWDVYTSAMILKVAEAMMLKRLISISGLVTKEEMAIEDEPIIIDTPKKGKVYQTGAGDMADDVTSTRIENEMDADMQEISDEDLPQDEEVIEEEKAELEFKSASDKQKDFIFGVGKKKGIVHSHLITAKEVEHIGKPEDLSMEKADKILKWWWGNKEKNIIGEQEKREKEEKANPKKGKNDLERRGELMKEVLDLMEENHIKPPERRKMYKKFQKDEIIKLAYEELEELKVLLDNYVPDWE